MGALIERAEALIVSSIMEMFLVHTDMRHIRKVRVVRVEVCICAASLIEADNGAHFSATVGQVMTSSKVSHTD